MITCVFFSRGFRSNPSGEMLTIRDFHGRFFHSLLALIVSKRESILSLSRSSVCSEFLPARMFSFLYGIPTGGSSDGELYDTIFSTFLHT